MRGQFCYHCGADWSDTDPATMTDAELDELEIYCLGQDADYGNLADGACPSCGFAYPRWDEDDDADTF